MRIVAAVLVLLAVLVGATAIWFWASITSEEVEFASGELTLRGTLLMPRSRSARSGVVLVHGSGQVSRQSVMIYGWLFAMKGFAVIAYDKRGVGASDGGELEWRNFNFGNLAADAAAAHQFLSSHPGVDDSRVGLFAASQGGWVAALAATQLDRAAFIIMASASLSTVAEDRIFGREAQVRHAGFDERSVAEAVELLQQDHRVTRSGVGFERYLQLWRKLSTRPWFKQVYGDQAPQPAMSAHRRWEKTVLDFDPRPLLNKLDLPVLWIFGDAALDRFSPVALSVERVQTAQAQGRCYEIIQIDGVGHTLEPETNNFLNFIRVRTSLVLQIYSWLDAVREGVACPVQAVGTFTPRGGSW